MKWKKLGKIFDPTKHVWKENFMGYAQSPQAIVFDDFVRIYFSIRNQDNIGTFISHIQFVDFNKNLKTIINISNHEVVRPGNLGCFDEHGIFPINVLRYNDIILGYTNGWSRRISVSVETAIGIVISKDLGFTFERLGDGPILSATTNEPFLVGDPFVKVIDGIFHMWYIFGIGWKKHSDSAQPDRIYKISHAISYNGIEWNKEEGKQIINDKLNEDECQALPTVIYFKNKYHMFFCYRSAFDFRKNKDNAYRLGYAYSNDIKNWTRDDSQVGIDVSKDGWDSDMLCYPHVFELNRKIYLLYNGNEFGKYGFGLAVLEM